jgi:hypothetical protein
MTMLVAMILVGIVGYPESIMEQPDPRTIACSFLTFGQPFQLGR